MYDLIVVGAGSAGAVVASRASENPNLNVLLIEAGPDYPSIEDTPFDLINGHNNSYRAHDWSLRYEPTAGQEVFFPRGRVTGGSSAVNTTIALRGVPEDYDEWAEAGCTGWSWSEVLPAFNRLERDLDYGDKDYHGDAGPISIRRPPQAELVAQQHAFLQTADRLDYPACDDANDPEGWGAGPHPMNKLGRLRVSVAVGYLSAARIRPNLTIRANSHVSRLLVEQDRCVGVEVHGMEPGAADLGVVEAIRGKTVVLSAGALMSPAILMRSGIGPADQLQSHGIELLSDLPGVGQNLCDHPAISVVCRIKDKSLVDFDAPIIQTILRYTAPKSDKRNDLQIEQLSFVGRPSDPASIGIAAVLEHQYGRGELTLNSADPFAPPRVQNRFCEDSRDTDRLVACYRDSLAFAECGELADMIEEVVFPKSYKRLSDDDLAELCRTRAGSGYHPCGTLKMGPTADRMAVVNPMGCCHGLDGLVVADASIMPSVPRANTNLTAIMIGEKIGEWLRTDPSYFGL